MSKFLAAALASLLFIAPAWAHSVLKSSVPADGATVTDPKTMELTFSDTVKLVTLKLTANGNDTVLPVDKSAAAAKSFSLQLPALEPAKYEVKWTASAQDGHVMTGSFSFTLVAGPNHKHGH